jgi:hypothetical protein
MPRYYLHIHNGTGFTRDEEGEEFSGRDGAYEGALVGIRSLLAADLERGEIDLNGRIEIADDAGTIVRTVPFQDAVEVRPARSKGQ